MRVAIVNETLPYPPTAGNRIRTLNLMLRLAKHHAVTYICRASETETETRQGISYLRDHGIIPIIADTAPVAKKGPGFYCRLAANLFSSQPYAVASHNSPMLRRKIRQMARSGEVDLFQFEWLAYADAVTDVEGSRSLVIAHNVESLIWKRWHETECSRLRALYLREQWRKFARYERRIFSSVSGVVCVSEEDARLALHDLSPRRVWVVDNGIDREYFQAASAPRQANSILFLGSLDWRPNLDAVRLLLDRIFPQVLRDVPSARLHIVGRRPPEWLKTAVAAARNVELHADVADVRTHLASASVMAVPLRVGGGSRLKILEALACGLPVVSTSIGCEGLSLTPGKEVRVCEIDQFANGLVWAISHPQSAFAMAEEGRRLVYQRYDWDVLAQRLETAWEQVIRTSTPAPAWPASMSVQPTLG